MSFNDPAKWNEIIIGSGVVSERLADSFKMTVIAFGDEAGLRTVSSLEVPFEAMILLTGNTGRSMLYLQPADLKAGYSVMRDPAYGVLIAAEGGFPLIMPDPVARMDLAEMRIKIENNMVYFYYNGVQVYSKTLAGWLSKQYKVLIKSNANLVSGQVVAGTNLASSGLPPPPAMYPLTISSTVEGIPFTIRRL